MTAQQQRIRQKHAQLAALRPLAPHGLAALDHWYDVELTYSSNAIEGSTLTRNETAIVLANGLTVSGKPLKDHLEAAGHHDALAYVRALALEPGPVREGDVRNIHRLVMQKVDAEESGRYSQHTRAIAGSSLVLPSPAEIPALMEDFATWLEGTTPTPKFAFDAHEKLITIHPFSDGNGRTSRLLMNLLLIKQGYPPVVILPEDKPAYFDALDATRKGEPNVYYDFLSERLEQSLDYMLLALQPDSVS